MGMELPVIGKRENTCNGCVECCVGFPLRPEADFWPEGKKAHEPCRFLKCDGCGIHDQPRPNICTDYVCEYIALNMPDDYYPKNCKVIISLQSARKNLFFQADDAKNLPGVDLNENCILLVETAQRALLNLESRRIRYYIGKKIDVPRLCCVLPYGIDHMYGGEGLHCRGSREGIFVAWKDTPDYAHEVKAWWTRN